MWDETDKALQRRWCWLHNLKSFRYSNKEKIGILGESKKVRYQYYIKGENINGKQGLLDAIWKSRDVLSLGLN